MSHRAAPVFRFWNLNPEEPYAKERKVGNVSNRAMRNLRSQIVTSRL